MRHSAPRQTNKALGTEESEHELANSLVTFDCPTYPAGHHVDWHKHLRGQLLYAISGIMSVDTDRGRWTVPPEQAVWIPPRVSHQVNMPCAVSMRSLYLRDDVSSTVSTDCKVVQVTPLLRELIVRLVSAEHQSETQLERLMSVLVDELQMLRSPPLHLPTPRDPRLRRICDELVNDIADNRELEMWSRKAGASTRTLARLFKKETGMSFSLWRQQLRILKAIELLAIGDSVTTIALNLGYQSPSAFISMFKRVVGITPGKFMESGLDGNSD